MTHARKLVTLTKLPENTRRNQLILMSIISVILIPGLFVYNYTQNNPKFCNTCHVMRSRARATRK